MIRVRPRRLVASLLSFSLVALSPGPSCYAALASSLKTRPGASGPAAVGPVGGVQAVPELGAGLAPVALDGIPALAVPPEAAVAGAVLAAPAAVTTSGPAIEAAVPAAPPAALSPAAPAREAVPAPAEDAQAGREEPAAADPSAAPARAQLRALPGGEDARRAAYDGAPRGGAAFGSGPTHTDAARRSTDEGLTAAFASDRVRAAFSAPGLTATLPEADEPERDRVRAALEGLSASAEPFEAPGVARTTLGAAAAALRRVILVDSLPDANPAALRDDGYDDYQVSHVGFGPAQDTPTIYLSRGFAAQAGPEALRAVLANDLVEIAARQAALNTGTVWTEDLARQVMERALRVAGRLQPRVAHYVRALVRGRYAAFAELGIPPTGVHREFLSADPAEQQAILNRLAALRAKGFAPESLTPLLLNRQRSLDVLLTATPESPAPAATLSALREFRDGHRGDFDRLTAGLALGGVLDGRPLPRTLPVDGHSQAQGLASRLAAALEAGRPIEPLLAGATEDPALFERLWGWWSAPERAPVIPSPERLPAVRAGLGRALQKVRAGASVESALFDRERKAVANLIRAHPLVRTWEDIHQRQRVQAGHLRAVRRVVGSARGTSAAAVANRDLKASLGDRARRLDESAREARDRITAFTDRAERLTQLSMAAREALHDAKGFSVGGDYLWSAKGRRLEVLIVVAGSDAPQPLKPEVLRQIAELTEADGVEVAGYVVGEQWLRQARLDADRNVLVSRFALRGLTLWGPNLAQFYGKLPKRELWAAAVDEVRRAEEALSERSAERAHARLGLAMGLVTALGLRLHGDALEDRLPGFAEAIEEDLELSEVMGRTPSRRPRNVAARQTAQAARIEALLEILRRQGREEAMRSQLAQRIGAGRRRSQPGRVGGLFLDGASERAAGLSAKNLYELTPAEAGAWMGKLVEAGAPVDNAAEKLALAHDQIKGNSQFWEWLPESLPVGRYARVGSTAFGRPVELRVRVGELEQSPELMGLLVDGASDDSVDRYDVFLNGAVLRMDPEAQQVVLSNLIRQLARAVHGDELDEARERARQELAAKRVADDRTDRDILERAVRDYREGVRVVELPDAAVGEWTFRGWRRRSEEEEVLRLAQGVSDHLRAPARRSSGRILIGYTDEDKREHAERMAEVFAANGFQVDIVEGEVVPGALHHAVREGPYRMGFLLTPDTVLPFGHFKGGLPEDEVTEIQSAEHAVKRVRRLALSAARLQGRITYRHDARKAYVASLRERFSTAALRTGPVRLVVDTDQEEVAVLLRALGLQGRFGVVDARGDEAQLRTRLAALGAGTRGLGVVFDRGSSQMRVLDVDGRPIRPSDLSLIFTWYLVERRGHRGRVFRAFTQTRLLDRIAARRGLSLEEVDPAVWGIDEADSIVLSPWTPYNDRMAQALLAAEIVAETGQSLSQLIDHIRADLGGARRYEKDDIELPSSDADHLSERLSDAEIRGFLAKRLGVAPEEIKAQKSVRGIQVTVGAGDPGAWMYLRWTQKGYELYAESDDAAQTRRLIDAGKGYVAQALAKAGPSGALRTSFLIATVLLSLGTAMVLLPLIDPAAAMDIPVLGWVYQIIGRVVEVGFEALNWLFPNFLRKVIPSWNTPWVMMLSVLMFVEFVWYWGVRAVIFYSSNQRTAPRGELAPEIERYPDLPKNPRPDTTDHFTVAALKDGHLAALKPAFARVWRSIQPLLFAYQSQTLILNKEYDDSNVQYRSAINARVWLFFKTLFLEPKILLLTWLSLLTAAFPGLVPALSRPLRSRSGPLGSTWAPRAMAWVRYAAGIGGAISFLLGGPVIPFIIVFALAGAASVGSSFRPGLPTHVSPPTGVPLPAALRGRYRTEYALVKKVSDGDTIQLFDGSFLGSRWVRYKGMDASDAKQTKAYKDAKALNTQMVRGKRILLLIPQVPHGDHLSDEYDVHGRLLSYVYVQDSEGRWVNMSKLMLDRGLANTGKGAPDPAVPLYMEISDPLVSQTSALAGPDAEPTDAPDLPAERLAPPTRARQWLRAAGATLSDQAEVLLDLAFAGDEGAQLSGRLGTGAAMGENSQFFVTGGGVRIGTGLDLRPGSRLNLQSVEAAGAQPGRISVGSGVRVEGRLRATVPPGGELRILSGTRIDGERVITVPPGRVVTLRNGPDGLAVETRYQHPRALLRQLRDALAHRRPIEELMGWLRTHKISPNELAKLWARGGFGPNGRVHLPRKLSQMKTVPKEPAAALDGLHGDQVARLAGAKGGTLVRSRDAALRRFLMRRQGERWEHKQALLAGLQQHHRVLEERQEEAIKELAARTRPRVERALDALSLNKKARDAFWRTLMNPDAAPDDEWTRTLERLDDPLQRAVRRIREAVEALGQLREANRVRMALYLERAKKNLAALSGLIVAGPRRVPRALSVIAAGPYLLTDQPKALELLVVVPGDAPPQRADPALFEDLVLPALESIRVVAVGHQWLVDNGRDGMRNRLATRFLVTGTTLWGKDIAAVSPANLGRKVPVDNHLNLAVDLLEEARAEDAAGRPQRARALALTAHWAALSAVPGLGEHLGDPESDEAVTPAGAIHRTRLLLARAGKWREEERLREVVSRGTDRLAVQQQTESGMGGVLVGDVRVPEFGGKPLFSVDSQEAWRWIRGMVHAAPAPADAQDKVTALLERLKARGQWWAWHPDALEVNRFVAVGRDSRGRLVEARVRVANAPQAAGALAVLAQSEEGRGISDVDRYEIFLNGVLFDLAPDAQEAVMEAAVRQLELALLGRSLRRARTEVAEEMGLTGKAVERSPGARVVAALADYERGIRTSEVPFVPVVPWEDSSWKAPLGLGEARRLAQGLADYLRRPGAAERRVRVSYATDAERAAAEAAAQVLVGNGAKVDILTGPAAAPAGAGPAELELWIGAEETRVLGKDGQPLKVEQSNDLGWAVLRTRHARGLDLGRARQQGLLTVAPPPATPAGAAPAPAPAAPAAAPARATRAFWQAFLIHGLLVGLVFGILAGAVFFPVTFASLPVIQTIFTMIRAMMMFKGFILVENPWILGIVLAGLVAALRYRHYGKIMYSMSQGEGRFHGLAPELEHLPRLNSSSSRTKGWSPVGALPDGRIGIRAEHFVRRSHMTQLLIYIHATARVRFMEHPIMRYLSNMANKVIIGRFKIARVSFFIATEPLLMLSELVMFWRAIAARLSGRPLALEYRVMPQSEQGMPLLPPHVQERFEAEWVTVTAVLGENEVQLEGGRSVRVKGAGKPGVAVSLMTTEARGLLQNQEVLLLTDKAQEDSARRLAGHLYVIERDASGRRRLVHALQVLVARHPARYGTELPNAVELDKANLSMTFALEDSAAPAAAPEKRTVFDKVFTLAVLAALGTLGTLVFAALTGAALAPVAHLLGWAALAVLTVPALFGLWRLLRGSAKRGFVMRHKVTSLVWTVLMAVLLLPLARDGGWASPHANRVRSTVVTVLEGTRLLPNGRLGYGEASEQARPPALLADDHFLVKQSRDAFGGVEGWMSVPLPRDVAENYVGIWANVSHVVDGDTIQLSMGRGVRYLGINTPETFHPGFSAKEGAQPFGEQSHARNAELTAGKRVLLLVPKGRGADDYGRVLAYVYAPDGAGRLVNVNVRLLEEGLANPRYGRPDELLRTRYPTLDASQLGVGAPTAVERPAPLRRLAMNPLETRSYVEEPARFGRWIDAQTLELSDGRVVSLRELDIPADKREAALAAARAVLDRPDQAVYLYHGKQYDVPGEPYQKDGQGRLLDYVYVEAPGQPGVYLNLNAHLFNAGFSTTREGRPDVVLPERTSLARDVFDYRRAAWEAAQAHVDALALDDGRFQVAYWHRIDSLTPATARPFEAGAALLSHYARMQVIPPAEHAPLLSRLIEAKDEAGYDAWVTEALAPSLRAGLERQRVPPPAGRSSWGDASWQDALLWAAAGKAGAVEDVIHFPSAAQAARMRAFMAAQGVPEASPWRFAEGVTYARQAMRLPPGLLELAPTRWIDWSAGAFWAPVEAAQIHRHLLYEHVLVRIDKRSRVSPALMAMAYSYPESALHLFSDARDYVALTHTLAGDVLAVPGLAQTAYDGLEGIVSQSRRQHVMNLVGSGQAGAAAKSLTPAELFMLGRRLADDARLQRFLLESQQKLRAKAGQLAMQGVGVDALEREMEALLALPGGGSIAGAPSGYESASSDEWRMQRRIFAEILVQTVLSMDEEDVPSRLLPALLPRAAETVFMGSPNAVSSSDWENIVSAVRRVTPSKIEGWAFEAMSAGLRPGARVEAGLLNRGFPQILRADLPSGVSGRVHENENPVGSLGFPGQFESDLKTFKRGTFRVDADGHGAYAGWKAGDHVRIMVGKKNARVGLFNTKILSIERKRLGELTLDDLRTEFPPTRFWNPLADEEALRKELIGELIKSLRSFYPEVDSETVGYMIRFRSYPEVQHDSRAP